MNNVIRDHTPFAHVLACDPKYKRIKDITRARSTCMHVRTAIDRWEWVWFFKPTAKLPTPNQQPSLEQYGILLIAHPTCSFTSHTSIAKIEGVAFSFSYLQSLESQSGLYSTIHNRLTICIQNPTYDTRYINSHEPLSECLEQKKGDCLGFKRAAKKTWQSKWYD